jgi:hypothetical protein
MVHQLSRQNSGDPSLFDVDEMLVVRGGKNMTSG